MRNPKRTKTKTKKKKTTTTTTTSAGASLPLSQRLFRSTVPRCARGCGTPKRGNARRRKSAVAAPAGRRPTPLSFVELALLLVLVELLLPLLLLLPFQELLEQLQSGVGAPAQAAQRRSAAQARQAGAGHLLMRCARRTRGGPLLLLLLLLPLFLVLPRFPHLSKKASTWTTCSGTQGTGREASEHFFHWATKPLSASPIMARHLGIICDGCDGSRRPPPSIHRIALRFESCDASPPLLGLQMCRKRFLGHAIQVPRMPPLRSLPERARHAFAALTRRRVILLSDRSACRRWAALGLQCKLRGFANEHHAATHLYAPPSFCPRLHVRGHARRRAV